MSAVSAARSPTAHQRFLVISDQDATLHAIAELLAQAGHACRCTDSISDALDLVESFAPHIIVVDLAVTHGRAPGISRALRVRGQGDDLFVVAIASFRATCTIEVASGFDACVSLPMDRTTLAQIALAAGARQRRCPPRA